MEQNRLQHELEGLRAVGAHIDDLVDTSFHANGFRFPDSDLRELFEDYLRGRDYRPEAKGNLRAREAISRYYSQSRVEVSPDRIIITASTSEAYGLLFSSLAEVGDNVLLPSPTYPLFEYLVDYARLEARYYDMRFETGFKIDFPSLISQIDKSTKFVVLISPNNPTGQIADEEEIDALLDICERQGSALISDEVFVELFFEGFRTGSSGAVPRPAGGGRNVPIFTLNGISKMFASPDLKLGWIAATGPEGRVDPLVDRLEIANDTFLSCTSLTQHILPGMFERGTGLFQTMRESLAFNRDRLTHGLGAQRPHRVESPQRPVAQHSGPVPCAAGMRVVTPTGGIHAVVGIPRLGGRIWKDDEEFAVQLLRETGIYVHPGYFYGMEEQGDELYVVVSFLKKPALLEPALSRFVSFVSAARDRVG